MILSGRVQGVGFRHSMVRQALKLGVTGWVRNLPDGRLEALLQGRAADLEAMTQWCSKGPPLAVVRNIEVSWSLITGEERVQSFEIRF